MKHLLYFERRFYAVGVNFDIGFKVGSNLTRHCKNFNFTQKLTWKYSSGKNYKSLLNLNSNDSDNRKRAIFLRNHLKCQ